jgi:hypothetical protein
MTRRRLAWLIAGADVVAIALVGLVSPDLGVDGALVYGFGIASFAGVGALLTSRVPPNPIGPLLLAAGTLLAAAMVLGAYADIGLHQASPWAGAQAARIIQGTLFVPPFFIALVGVPLIFPDGRLASPRFRWIARIAIANMAAWPAVSIPAAVRDAGFGPIAYGGLFDLAMATFTAFFSLATLVSFGAAALAIALRFRRGDPVEREQIKWLLAVVAVGAAILPVSFLLTDAGSPELADLLSNLSILTLFALPIVIAIAVLRYRLFEIDRIISRTISWALVTTTLVAAFGAGVLVLQASLSGVTQGQTLAVAASTLLAAALFQPLRRRIQLAVDRRFDRAGVDGDRTVAAYAERMRDVVAIDALSTDLEQTVSGSLHPARFTLWLREPGR